MWTSSCTIPGLGPSLFQLSSNDIRIIYDTRNACGPATHMNIRYVPRRHICEKEPMKVWNEDNDVAQYPYPFILPLLQGEGYN